MSLVLNSYSRAKCGIIPLDIYSHLCYYCTIMSSIIKGTDFKIVAEGVKLDAKKRVLLSKVPVPKGVTFHIYLNNIGQIVLDPHVSIPASEVWLWENKEALTSVKRGLLESAQGLAKSRGSFAEYAEDAP